MGFVLQSEAPTEEMREAAKKADAEEKEKMEDEEMTSRPSSPEQEVEEPSQVVEPEVPEEGHEEEQDVSDLPGVSPTEHRHDHEEQEDAVEEAVEEAEEEREEEVEEAEDHVNVDAPRDGDHEEAEAEVPEQAMLGKEGDEGDSDAPAVDQEDEVVEEGASEEEEEEVEAEEYIEDDAPGAHGDDTPPQTPLHARSCRQSRLNYIGDAGVLFLSDLPRRFEKGIPSPQESPKQQSSRHVGPSSPPVTGLSTGSCLVFSFAFQRCSEEVRRRPSPWREGAGGIVGPRRLEALWQHRKQEGGERERESFQAESWPALPSSRTGETPLKMCSGFWIQQRHALARG